MADKEKRKPTPGAGDVPIMLDGKQHVMSPSCQTCMAISDLAGGANQVLRRLHDLDFRTIVEVVALGTGYTSMKERQMIQEAVYQQGTLSIAADCMIFVRAVNNGGMIPLDDDEGGEADADAPLSQPPSSTDA